MSTTVIQGKVIIPGTAKGQPLITDEPINFTAAMCKPLNLLPGFKPRMNDRHHNLYKSNIKGKVLVFPSCIGSTHTGLVLLDLASLEQGPAALLVQEADSLLVSGITLSDIWYEKSIPIIELPKEQSLDVFNTGAEVSITVAGEIRIS